jgi:hypothetical protein
MPDKRKPDPKPQPPDPPLEQVLDYQDTARGMPQQPRKPAKEAPEK